MKYSVIIPCYNESHVIGQCLASVNVAREGRNDVQVIVVDNGSTDTSGAIARAHQKHPLDQVIDVPRLRISAVRNAGARISSGEIILFLDSDIEVPSNWLTTLDDWFGQQRSDVLGFVDLPPVTAPWVARIWGERVLARRHTAGEVDFLPGRNICVLRRWFDAVGGFSETLTTGEDKDFVMRLGKAGARVMTDRSIPLIHLGYERNFREWMRKEYWRQHSHIDLLREQGVSPRLIRFPLLAIGHLGLVLLAAICLLAAPKLGVFLLLASFLPSLVLTLRCPPHRSNPERLLQSTLLYWARFNIAAVSILRAAQETFLAGKGANA
ncbi:Glycosyl transferase, family 2 [gamma proteobacterium HdN1]|nr:Glycosyl transferase, family 2 [gamma proteobacterium HdN1]